MPADAAFCPGCGRRMIIAPASVTDTGPLSANLAAALAYFTFVPALIFLLLPRFKLQPLVRFHSVQSIALHVICLLCGIILRVLFIIFSVIPRFGYLLGSLAVVIVLLGLFFLWIVAVVKAFQGEFFKLPIIGGFAEGR